MTNPTIKPTTTGDIAGLKKVLHATELFPAEMLPDLLAPTLAGETEAFWLSCHHGGATVGLCYTVPEELAEGACPSCGTTFAGPASSSADRRNIRYK